MGKREGLDGCGSRAAMRLFRAARNKKRTHCPRCTSGGEPTLFSSGDAFVQFCTRSYRHHDAHDDGTYSDCRGCDIGRSNAAGEKNIMAENAITPRGWHDEDSWAI